MGFRRLEVERQTVFESLSKLSVSFAAAPQTQDPLGGTPRAFWRRLIRSLSAVRFENGCSRVRVGRMDLTGLVI